MKSEFKKLGISVVICLVLCVLFSIFISAMLHLGLFATISTYIYRLYTMLALCALVFCGIIYGICKVKTTILLLPFSTCILCVGISAIFMSLFFSLGPMVIERSYTVYSLAYLTDYENEYTYEEIRDQFVTGYVDNGATQKRIDEQVSIGNIEKVGDKYRITEKGKSLVYLFRFIEKIFPVSDLKSIYPSEVVLDQS